MLNLYQHSAFFGGRSLDSILDPTARENENPKSTEGKLASMKNPKHSGALINDLAPSYDQILSLETIESSSSSSVFNSENAEKVESPVLWKDGRHGIWSSHTKHIKKDSYPQNILTLIMERHASNIMGKGKKNRRYQRKCLSHGDSRTSNRALENESCTFGLRSASMNFNISEKWSKKNITHKTPVVPLAPTTIQSNKTSLSFACSHINSPQNKISTPYAQKVMVLTRTGTDDGEQKLQLLDTDCPTSPVKCYSNRFFVAPKDLDVRLHVGNQLSIETFEKH
eukprot:CFRG7723T1